MQAIRKKVFVSFVFKFTPTDPWNFSSIIVANNDGDIESTADLFGVMNFLSEELRKAYQSGTGILSKVSPLVQILNWKTLEDIEEVQESVLEDTGIEIASA